MKEGVERMEEWEEIEGEQDKGVKSGKMREFLEGEK